jgi:hypothetical protein
VARDASCAITGPAIAKTILAATANRAIVIIAVPMFASATLAVRLSVPECDALANTFTIFHGGSRAHGRLVHGIGFVFASSSGGNKIAKD